MGLTPIALFAACLLAARNQRILSAYDARQARNNQRTSLGLPPRTRRRRRKASAAAHAASAPRAGSVLEQRRM